MKTAQELGITEEQKKNLLTMAKYLIRTNMFGRPKLKARFDMMSFAQKNIKDTHTCGTVGCVVGHGPYALGIQKETAEAWWIYAGRVFGIHSSGYIYSQRPAFSFLFSGNWSRVDNTPYGAAQRIIYFLKNGAPTYAYNSGLFDEITGESVLRLMKKAYGSIDVKQELTAAGI